MCKKIVTVQNSILIWTTYLLLYFILKKYSFGDTIAYSLLAWQVGLESMALT